MGMNWTVLRLDPEFFLLGLMMLRGLLLIPFLLFCSFVCLSHRLP
jgi:hypothetical protein